MLSSMRPLADPPEQGGGLLPLKRSISLHLETGKPGMSDVRENSRLGHLFRPSPFSRDRAYWLDGHVLHWRSGVEGGRMSLSEVKSVRVILPPAGQGTARCIIRTAEGGWHRFSDDYWFGWNRVERHRWGTREHRRGSFLGLVAALARRARKANPAVALTYGPGRGRPFAPEDLNRARGFAGELDAPPPEQGEDGKPSAA